MKMQMVNADAELRKFLAGKPTKVDPAVLLTIVGGRYLDGRKAKKRGDS